MRATGIVRRIDELGRVVEGDQADTENSGERPVADDMEELEKVLFCNE